LSAKCSFEISKLTKKNKTESDKDLQISINKIEELLDTIKTKKVDEKIIVQKVFF
jgi:hypothetical protein